MPRRLSVSRAQVAGHDEREYLTALGQLAGRLAARGGSLWLFRHPSLPGTFLEFSESASPERHRAGAPNDPDEAGLERRLRALAGYAADAWVLWEEVPLEKS